MKKIYLLLTTVGLLFNVSLFACSSVIACCPLAVLNPDQWGLDKAFSAIIAVGVSYIIGLFTKKPNIKRK